MHIQRNELVELLRSRGNDRTGARAEQSLPEHIDLDRDRRSLRRCGIDPNVLAAILSRRDRATDVTEPLSLTATESGESGGSARVAGAPRTIRAEDGPSFPDTRTASETTSAVSQLSVQPSPGSQQHADQTTSGAGKENAGFRVTPRPAIRCPRCRFTFGSTDLMLDHLNTSHLNVRHSAHASVDSDSVTQRSSRADRAVTPPDVVPADLGSASRGASKQSDPRRLVIGTILACLLIIWIVAVLV